MAKKDKSAFIPCRIMNLPEDMLAAARKTAVDINPANDVPEFMMHALVSRGGMGGELSPGALAVLTNKYWGSDGAKLSVSFMDNPSKELRDRILSHMNAWSEFCNISFAWSQSTGQVRIDRSGREYWSYLGPDILHIPLNQPTMRLGGFTMNTPESEYRRVVRHETGHTAGFPHEHMLPEIVALLDIRKTIIWAEQALGWDESMARSQILTPLNPNSIRMSAHADVNGVMCYMLPASITKNGRPIPGGNDIDQIDREFAAVLYPLKVTPPPPPPISVGTTTFVLTPTPGDPKSGTYKIL